MKKFAMTAMLVTVFGLSRPAEATENGVQHYPIGSLTVASGTLPPPGMLQWLNYGVATWNPNLAGNQGTNAVPDFSLSTWAEAPRFLYTWSNAMVGPFHYTTGLVTPFIHADLNVEGHTGRDTNFGDIDIENYLGYASPDHKLFYYFGFETYMPTGHYNKHDLLSVGSNYWTFGPSFDITWNVNEKFELAATAISEFNTENHADRYHSGNDFDLDWGTTYRPLDRLPKFGVGIQGYVYKQFTDDKVSGISVFPDGHRGQEIGFGPQLRYDIPFGGFVLKYQHEYEVRNRPRGAKVWLEFAIPLFGKPASGGDTRPAL